MCLLGINLLSDLGSFLEEKKNLASSWTPSCPKSFSVKQLSVRHGRFVKPITDNWFTMAKNTSMNYSSLFCVLNSVVPGYVP